MIAATNCGRSSTTACEAEQPPLQVAAFGDPSRLIFDGCLDFGHPSGDDELAPSEAERMPQQSGGPLRARLEADEDVRRRVGPAAVCLALPSGEEAA